MNPPPFASPARPSNANATHPPLQVPGPPSPAQTPPVLNLQLYAGLSIPGPVETVYSIQYALKEASDDFLIKNNAAVQIVFPTNAPKSVELISEATGEEFFSSKGGSQPKGWDLCYRRFPDSSGLLTSSRVGIDSKGTVAIVYLGQQRQYLDGSGSICILKSKGKKWVLNSDSIGSLWRS